MERQVIALTSRAVTSPSRREQLSNRLATSSFVRKVVGPKVVEPLNDWYEASASSTDNPDTGVEATAGGPPAEQTSSVADAPAEHEVDVRDIDVRDAAAVAAATGTEGSVTVDTAADDPPASASLAAARSAEAFFAGPDAGIEPEPQPRAQPEQPATPAVATGLRAAVKDILQRVKVRVKEHNLNVVAAGVAFWALLAIPATLTAALSIYGLVADPDDVEEQIEDALSGASEEVRELIGDQLSSIAGGSGGGLALGAIIGIVLALWTSSGAVAKVIATLNVIFGVPEDRRFAHLRGLSVLLTLGAVVAVGAAAFVLAALPTVLAEAGLGDLARWLINVGRFPAMLVLMAMGLSILYSLGPNVPRRFRILSWGAVWATALWLFVSGLFSIYTANFASYNETYGTIGGLVVVLLWLFLTAFMVLIGAEIDAARDERARELEAAP